MSEQQESCPTKSVLLAAWQSAAEVYAKAVSELSRHVGVLRKDDYEKLKQVAEDARHRSQEAQATLETHVLEHGCNGNGGEITA